jgi:hypothetical protein
MRGKSVRVIRDSALGQDQLRPVRVQRLRGIPGFWICKHVQGCAIGQTVHFIVWGWIMTGGLEDMRMAPKVCTIVEALMGEYLRQSDWTKGREGRHAIRTILWPVIVSIRYGCVGWSAHVGRRGSAGADLVRTEDL